MPTVFSTDQSYLEGLIHTVTIEQDLNASGTTVGQRGTVGENFVAVFGWVNIVAFIQIEQPRRGESNDKESGTVAWTVLFGQNVALDIRHRIVWVDPDFGVPRYGYVEGKSINDGNTNHHWYAEAKEFVA